MDINGDDENWSYPKNDLKKRNWCYYFDPWEKVYFSPDFVLIDGRFRVACLLHLLLNTTDFSIMIAIHDYRDREHYHVVENFLDILECKETLYIFRINIILYIYNEKYKKE